MTELYTSLQIHDVFVGIKEREGECVTAKRELEYKSLLGSKVEVLKQEMNYGEGDVFKDIQDVWVVEKEEDMYNNTRG